MFAQNATRAIMRPYITEIIIVFAAGWCIGHYTAKDIPTIAEVKKEVQANPEAAAAVVHKREPLVQYGDGKLSINIGRVKK